MMKHWSGQKGLFLIHRWLLGDWEQESTMLDWKKNNRQENFTMEKTTEARTLKKYVCLDCKVNNHVRFPVLFEEVGTLKVEKEKNILLFLFNTGGADTHEDSFFVRVRRLRGGGEHKSTGGSNWRDSSWLKVKAHMTDGTLWVLYCLKSGRLSASFTKLSLSNCIGFVLLKPRYCCLRCKTIWQLTNN